MAEEKKVSSEAEASYPEKTNSVEVGPGPEDTGLDGFTEGFDAARTRKLLRKMDWNIVPFFSLLYLLSFLDRTNIGNARLVGLESSLGMSGIMYNVALAIFFPFYVAAEIPSNIMLKRLGAQFWFPFIMVCWGITMTLMGVVKNYPGLLVVRAVLGFAEGGLFPGVTWYLSVWYRRHECALRMAIFFSAATAAGAFGGLLARGIAEMTGVAGLPGWAWIFILEGIATVIVSIIAYFMIASKPDNARFLTPEERIEVARRLKHDRSHLADEYHIKYFYQAIQDWKIWVHMVITIGIYTGLYSFSLFLPTIVRNMGFQNNEAQLLTVPPYVVACIFTVGGGFLSDRSGQRGIYMIFFCCLALIGWIMLISTTTPAVQYVGTVFAACGIYPNVSLGVAWNGNNIGGSTKRAVGIAMHVGFGNLGGTIGAFLFLPDRPAYVPYSILIALNGMALILCVFMTIYLRRENARRDRVAHENGWGEPHSYSVDKMEAEREKGDYATFFRYTI